MFRFRVKSSSDSDLSQQSENVKPGNYPDSSKEVQENLGEYQTKNSKAKKTAFLQSSTAKSEVLSDLSKLQARSLGWMQSELHKLNVDKWIIETSGEQCAAVFQRK